MGRVTHFEDLEVWKEARLLCKEIHSAVMSGRFGRDYSMIDQLRRSSGSVMDNIAEGFERDGTREFIQFLSYAKGSIGEVRSQINRALDNEYLTQEAFDSLSLRAREIARKLAAFIRYLRDSNIKGSKFVQEPAEEYRKTDKK